MTEMRFQPTKSQRESFRGRFFILLILTLFSPASLVLAQTTTFTYQGRFTDGGTAANGVYEMQFKLFDSPTVGAGNQISSTMTNSGVTVSSGVFTVPLDFGAAGFSGADRFLEIGVRLAGDVNPYTLLSPRQQLTSAVYAIRAGSTVTADAATTATTATNATQLGGVAAAQYIRTGDLRLTDSRTPTAGSSSYIQNGLNQQPANFNISGNGRLGGTLSANTVNSDDPYQMGGVPVFNAASFGTFAGMGAGSNGGYNSFFGNDTGRITTIQGTNNSFFGANAGYANTSGKANSVFGSQAGSSSDVASENAIFGFNAGRNNTGSKNSFFGSRAGQDQTTGSKNTAIGSDADIGVANLTNATAIGAGAYVTHSNSLVLGAINGVNGASTDTNVGIGTTAPNAKFHVAINGGNLLAGDASAAPFFDPGCTSAFAGISFSTFLGCRNYAIKGNGNDLFIAAQGSMVFGNGEQASSPNPQPEYMVLNKSGVEIFVTLRVNTLSVAGSTPLCRNAFNQISACSSSLRYKKNLQPFTRGLSLLNSLKPITFNWKADNLPDLGFGAEDIAAVEPLLVTHNEKGEVEGVKYDRITAVLVNAVKEQQQQIAQQQVEIKELKQLIRARHQSAARRRR
jgi:hypothetical protein